MSTSAGTQHTDLLYAAFLPLWCRFGKDKRKRVLRQMFKAGGTTSVERLCETADEKAWYRESTRYNKRWSK